MARFKLLPTPPKTPPVTLLTAAFKRNKKRNNKYKETQPKRELRKKKMRIIGICILYNHKTEYNYTYRRRGKGSY